MFRLDQLATLTMADYESVLCVKNEVFVYRIPARTSNRGYRAAEWKLDEPDWTGRLKVVAKGQALTVRLEDKNSGELFAQCPVDSYPSAAVEQVLDSSRYFVLRIQDGSGRAAFIGLGFADRGDSFDLVVAIQDHFKQLKREEAAKSDEVAGISQLNLGPKLDLSFKEGQTITINIATKKSGESSTQSSSTAGVAKQRARAAPGTGISPLLPPPPGSGTRVAALPKQPAAAAALTFQEQPVRPPPNSTSGVTGGGFMQPAAVKPASYNSPDFLVDFGSSPPKSAASVVGASSGVTGSADPLGGDWDDFSRASSQLPAKVHSTTHQPLSDHNWVNFD